MWRIRWEWIFPIGDVVMLNYPCFLKRLWLAKFLSPIGYVFSISQISTRAWWRPGGILADDEWKQANEYFGILSAELEKKLLHSFAIVLATSVSWSLREDDFKRYCVRIDEARIFTYHIKKNNFTISNLRVNHTIPHFRRSILRLKSQLVASKWEA